MTSRYYVHLQSFPPRVTFIHPADETPPSSSSPQSCSPVRGSTPQQQQHQQITASFRQSVYNQNSSSQQPSRLSPTFSNPMPQYAPQQQQMYRNLQSFGESTTSVQDYTMRQQQNTLPPENNPSPFAMHRARQPSEAQSIYGTSIPQSLQMPSDSRFSIYSTNSQSPSQEMEFDASILYLSPISASSNPPVPKAFGPPVPVSQIFQPNRRQGMSSESFLITPSNQATYPQRSQTVQVSDPATRRFQSPNVLRRRKTKATAALAPIPQKPAKPPAFQKPSEVPVYNLVAQAPLDTNAKPTTPSFQTTTYSRPPLPYATTDPIQNYGSVQTAVQQRSQSLPPISTSNQGSTMMQGLVSQNSAPNHLTQTSAPITTSGLMAMPQQTLSPIRSEITGGGPSVNSSLPYLNSQMLGSTVALSNGTMGAPLNSMMNHTPSLMSMPSNPLDGYSNGTAALPMTSIPPLALNQPQSLQSQLNGLLNGTMSAPLVSPTMMLPQPQEPDSFSNGLSGNNAMAQPPFAMAPLQPSMLLNGYAQGLPSGAAAIQMQGGMTQQIPEVIEDPAAKSTKDKQNKQIMKKVGMSLGKAVLKFGTKYALEQIGVDEGEIFAYMEHFWDTDNLII